MKRVTRNGLLAVAAASGALAVTMPAHADSTADGGTAGSPGLISGDTIQFPVHIPVNVCGNTVNVVGLLNPAAGNGCANESHGSGPAAGGGGGGGGGGRGGRGYGNGGEGAQGGAVALGSGKDSPGVLSGNVLQLPVHLPVNVSGNSVTVAGLGNASVGNQATNTSGGLPHHPLTPTPRPHTPPRAVAHPGPRHYAPPPAASLAHTGTDQTVPAIAASGALVLGGAVLYRRFRPVVVR
ncbi:chaplin [Streptomyces sp. NBC_01136]|uniref:chaplin n=1 Tax=unclassified Streptomyces TaxID=2593676 RepID=UPI00324EC405|nr:chaplin [Streptomyces sp. NBC_01136]